CFFFQAEDGIRAFHVTGVQTCALPIWLLGAVDQRSAAPTPEDGGGSGSLVDGTEKPVPKITLGPSTVSRLRVTTDGHASGLVNEIGRAACSERGEDAQANSAGADQNEQ